MTLDDLYIFHDEYPELFIENDKWENPVIDLDRAKYWDTNFDWYGEWTLGTNLSPQSRWYGFRSFIDRFPSIEECNPFKKAISVSVQKGEVELIYAASTGGYYPEYDFQEFDLTNVNATLTINWGDNSTPEVIANYDESIVEHIYSLEGDFHVSYILTFTFDSPIFSPDLLTLTEGFVGDDDQTIFPVSGILCEKTDQEVLDEAYSGSYQLKAKIWIHDNFLGNKVGSYTHGYKYKSGGEWKICLSNIRSDIHAWLRDEDCINPELKYESDSENNQFQVDAVENKLKKNYMSYGVADINSYHKMTKSGTEITLTLKIKGCQ